MWGGRARLVGFGGVRGRFRGSDVSGLSGVGWRPLTFFRRVGNNSVQVLWAVENPGGLFGDGGNDVCVSPIGWGLVGGGDDQAAFGDADARVVGVRGGVHGCLRASGFLGGGG